LEANRPAPRATAAVGRKAQETINESARISWERSGDRGALSARRPMAARDDLSEPKGGDLVQVERRGDHARGRRGHWIVWRLSGPRRAVECHSRFARQLRSLSPS